MTTEKTKGRRREPITPDRVDQIVALVNRWTKDWDKLSGPALENKVKSCLKLELTRQGMLKHKPIQIAFESKQKELSGGKKKRVRAPDEQLLAHRVATQAEEIDALRGTIAEYDNRFARFIYNAKMKGVAAAELDKPIPSNKAG